MLLANLRPVFLTTMGYHHKQPMRDSLSSNEPILPSELTLRSLFSDMEVIKNYNSALLVQLQKRKLSWGPYQKIGMVFRRIALHTHVLTHCIAYHSLVRSYSGDVFVRMNHFLKAYSNYCKHYKEALITLGNISMFFDLCAEVKV